ncbi:MAG: hypothetical protein ACXACD_22060, partial [Candidatus Thorarchaeota archaeon]
MIWKHKTKHILRIALLIFFISNYGPELSSAKNAAEKQPVQLQLTERVEKYIYKHTPQGELAMYVHFPKDWTVGDKRSTIVFFFGGGWSEGTVKQFLP